MRGLGPKGPLSEVLHPPPPNPSLATDLACSTDNGNDENDDDDAEEGDGGGDGDGDGRGDGGGGCDGGDDDDDDDLTFPNAGIKSVQKRNPVKTALKTWTQNSRTKTFSCIVKQMIKIRKCMVIKFEVF